MPRSSASNSAIDDVRLGQVFADRYEIVRRLGVGGMAVVYAGVDRMLKRDVALKILKPQVMDDPKAMERLRREARAAGQLHHRHIITFHDVGSSDGAVFIVMELLRGRTLAAERRRCHRLAPGRAARIGGQVASALRVVHGAGIVHRDLKPDNIFLVEHAGDDFCKLLDFSIAKLPATLVDGRITQTGTVHGTPHYMPPEQAVGDPVSPASDIYALGAVLFEMLVGRPPFFATNVVELLTVQSVEDAPLVSTLEPDCPPALEALVARMLARDPADRPGSAEEVARALAAIEEQCARGGAEPPPLPRKRMPAADRTVQHDPRIGPGMVGDTGPAHGTVEAPGAGDEGESDTPTQPLQARKRPISAGVMAPSAVAAPAAAAGTTARPTPARTLQRPRSMKTRAVARRTASAATPAAPQGGQPGRVAPSRTQQTRTSVRASQRGRQVTRRRSAQQAVVGRGTAARGDRPKAPTARTAASPSEKAGDNAENPGLQLPDAPPPNLPDAVTTEGRVVGRLPRSTMPSWSGQTSPDATDGQEAAAWDAGRGEGRGGDGG